jgi:hypothetical protein
LLPPSCCRPSSATRAPSTAPHDRRCHVGVGSSGAVSG